MKTPAKVIRVASLICLCATLADISRADLLYDNGPPAISGRESTRWLQAQDFNLSNGGLIGSAAIYIADLNRDPDLSAWGGIVEYSIFSHSIDGPDQLLASGNGSVRSLIDTGVDWDFGGNAWEVLFDLETPFTAAPITTYWLGIHLDSDFGNREDVYWVRTASETGFSGYETDRGDLESWRANRTELAFNLLAVPEPNTMALLLVGVAPRWLPRRHRLAKQVTYHR
ncbi:MAG: hypothetical protein AAF266_10785 [Planctomycetota bacterium]